MKILVLKLSNWMYSVIPSRVYQYAKTANFFLIIVVLWLTYSLYIQRQFNSQKEENKNTGILGDSYGVITSLFSALGFAGLIYTIYLQRNDLNEQRKQFKDQKFESTFFNLINLHNGIVENMDIRKKKDKAIIVAGRDCFKYIFRRFKQIIEKAKDRQRDENVQEFIKALEDNKTNISLEMAIYKQKYKYIFRRYHNDLGHYHRNLYHLVKYVDDGKLNQKEEEKFIRIIRSTLSSMELLLLYYNVLLPENKAMKDYIKKYDLLHTLDETLLFEEDHSKDYFDNLTTRTIKVKGK